MFMKVCGRHAIDIQKQTIDEMVQDLFAKMSEGKATWVHIKKQHSSSFLCFEISGVIYFEGFFLDGFCIWELFQTFLFPHPSKPTLQF